LETSDKDYSPQLKITQVSQSQAIAYCLFPQANIHSYHTNIYYHKLVAASPSMSAAIKWLTSKPSDGLRPAMERISREVADNGEYTSVEIMYDLFIPEALQWIT
jgi:hypothetical protein